MTSFACDVCRRRSWLIARLSGHIELAWAARRPLPAVLSLPDAELIAALGGSESKAIATEYDRFDPAAARALAERGKIVSICSCDARYPERLHDLPDPPAVLHLRGAAERLERVLAGAAVAIVGARRASPYGLEQARTLARGLSAAGVAVVSGMALGVDAAAHAGALEVDGATVAVLGGGPDRPYPASKRRLYERIVALGVVVSEMPAGSGVRRWCFPARNRLIAALTRVTVVVEAGERSGSLITASLAADLGREVAALPGLVSSPLAAGTNGLIAEGARLVRGPQDVLELLFGADAPAAQEPDRDAGIPDDLRAVLMRVREGHDTVAALARSGLSVDAVLASLAQLELRGRVRRATGGRYVAVA